MMNDECKMKTAKAHRSAAVHSSFITQHSAFTLIELVLVLAILAIVAASVAPSLRGFGVGRRANDAATLLAGFATYARTQAVTESRPYRLQLDPAGKGFWLTYQEGAEWIEPNNDFGKRIELPTDLVMRTDLTNQTDGTYAEFLPTGRVTPARVWIDDALGGTTEIASASATEPFRVLTAAETSR